MKKTFYNKKGQATGAVEAMITLIVGSGVAVMVLIFVGVLSGQAYNIVEPKLDNISDATIKASVKNSISSGFSALEQVGDFLPLIILAIVISIVLFLILSFTAFGNMGGGRGSAL